MIYFEIKEKHETFAIYKFGMTIEDMSGEVTVFSSFVEPQIIKQPTSMKVPNSWLNQVIVKYKEQLLNGAFPPKMSFER